MKTERTNLKGKTTEELEWFALENGESSFRGRQLFKWIYARGESDFSKMTDISKILQKKLSEISYISALETVEISKSDNLDTEKFLFRLEDGNLIETVLMRYEEQRSGRATVCISSQAGCAQGCAFCASGKNGLVRNLTPAEIVDQVIQIQNYLRESGERAHNVVIMGIGEPLANFDNVLKSIALINHGDGVAISKRRIAVSTVGIPPLIKKFADVGPEIRFAVSLHAPDDETRNKIMPVNRKYPIADLLDACRYYQDQTGRRITFAYMLTEGLNDSPEHAKKLAGILIGLSAMVNLIPLNPTEHFPYKRPSRKKCEAFSKEMEKHGYKAPLRVERGTAIDAACGQLRLRKLESIVEEEDEDL